MLKSRRFWLGVVFSVAFLGLFFWRVDPGETARALKGANYLWIIPALGAYFIAVLFRTVRWHFLLLPLKTIPTRRLYPIVVIGYMANNLLPVRLGELVRAFFLGQKEGVSASATLATIVLERVFDGIVLLVLALAIWPFLPVADLLHDFSEDRGIAQGLLVFAISAPFLVVLALFLAMAFSPRLGRAAVRSLLRFVPHRLKGPAELILTGFLQGLASLRSPRRVLAALLFTLPIWLAEATMYHLIGFGFHLGQPFHAILLATATSNLATSLPSTAGGVGPFEYATLLTLESLGVGAKLAAAYAIVLHVALLAPVTLLGLFFLWSENISLGEMARRPSAALAEGYEPQPAREVKP